jgi:hypothetical protein
MGTRNKLYYPKSHIITGLHTAGKEWMLEDGTEYFGYYHTYIDGTVLTGATYSQTYSQTLIPYVNSVEQPTNYLYNSLVTNKRTYTSPVYTFPIPTLDDYHSGVYTRYFVRRRNYSTYTDIIEIDSKQFSTLNTPNTGIDGSLYLGISINWKLTGPLKDTKEGYNIVYGVEDTNSRLVHLKDNDLKGLKYYLTDYTELTIYSPYVSKDIKKLFVS